MGKVTVLANFYLHILFRSGELLESSSKLMKNKIPNKINLLELYFHPLKNRHFKQRFKT